MRLAVAMSICFGLGPIGLADTPSPPPPGTAAAPGLTVPAPAVPESAPVAPQSEAAPTAAAPSSAATPPAASASGESQKAAATTDHREKLLMAKGYRMEMRNGEKVYCKTEEVIGSRLGGRKVCGTIDQIQSREQGAKDWAQSVQQHQITPMGN